MSHAAPAIVIKNASLSYGAQVLFTDLNYTIAAGQTTCLLGPSGIGKTSLLRSIAQLPNQDIIYSPETSIHASDKLPLSGRIAYMAQTNLLMPWLTVLDNILLGRRLRREKNLAAAKTKARELLAQVGLTDAEKKYPRQLSGGMQQRVALIRTLMENRPIILMDEPFSALDAVTRLRLQELTAELFKERTVLLITHDPLEALRIGHHVLLMTGKPARLSSPIDLTSTPPRALTDPELLRLQGELMQRLVETS